MRIMKLLVNLNWYKFDPVPKLRLSSSVKIYNELLTRIYMYYFILRNMLSMCPLTPRAYNFMQIWLVT